MPVYNGADYLKQAIDSILHQTYRDFELLVVNDGSTDSTRELLRTYSDPQLIVAENKRNCGLIASLNQGLEMARGEFVARMDHDDLALPRRLEKQINFLRKNTRFGLCGTWFQSFGAGAPTIARPPCHADDMAARLFVESPLGHPTVMFRRALFSEHALRYEDGFLHAEDYELWTRVAEVTELANVPEVLLQYRRHGEQSSTRSKLRQEETVAKIRERQLRRIYPNASDIERTIHLTILSNCAFEETQISVATVESWLLKLIRFNESAIGGFPAEAFRRAIAYVWWRYCSSRLLAPDIIRSIYRSELSNVLPLRNKLRILAMQLKAATFRS